MLRIIAGRYRGRRLKSPKGLATRPVLGRVREALFNVLGDIEGLSFLDLFSGTGAMGIEALSRGARHATFVELAAHQSRIIRGNLDGIDGDYRIVTGDALKTLARVKQSGKRFDIVFADPPYDKGLSQKTTDIVAGGGVLSDSGVLVLTVRSGEELPSSPGCLGMVFDRRYGDTRAVIYRNTDSPEESDDTGTQQ